MVAGDTPRSFWPHCTCAWEGLVGAISLTKCSTKLQKYTCWQEKSKDRGKGRWSADSPCRLALSFTAEARAWDGGRKLNQKGWPIRECDWWKGQLEIRQEPWIHFHYPFFRYFLLFRSCTPIIDHDDHLSWPPNSAGPLIQGSSPWDH